MADEHDGFGPVRPRSRFGDFAARIARGEQPDAAAIAAGGTGRPESARARQCARKVQQAILEDARALLAEAAHALSGGRDRTARRFVVEAIAMQRDVVEQLPEADRG